MCEHAHVPAIMHVCQTINTECIYVLCAFTYFLYTADLNAFPLQDGRCTAETRKTDKALWRRKQNEDNHIALTIKLQLTISITINRGKGHWSLSYPS